MTVAKLFPAVRPSELEFIPDLLLFIWLDTVVIVGFVARAPSLVLLSCKQCDIEFSVFQWKS